MVFSFGASVSNEICFSEKKADMITLTQLNEDHICLSALCRKRRSSQANYQWFLSKVLEGMDTICRKSIQKE